LAKKIDISGRLTNERPILKLGEGLEFEVDNRKNTVFEMNALVESSESAEKDMFDQVFNLLLGKEATKKINDLDLSFENYQYVFMAAIATATGEEVETVEKRFQAAKATI